MPGRSPKTLRSRLLDRFRFGPRDQTSQVVPRHPIPIFNAPLADATIASRLSQKAPSDLRPISMGSGSQKDSIVVEIENYYRFWCPAIVVRTLEYLNVHGLDEEGLYRVPGSSETIKRLKADFDYHGDLIFEDIPHGEFQHGLQIADVASLFKQFLRELPTPMISQTTVDKLEADLEEPTRFREVLSNDMEPYEFYLLSILCNHLIAVSTHANKNKMDIHNLSIVFCSSSNLGIGSNVFTALVKEEIWNNLYCKKEAEALAEERRVLNTGPAVTSTDQIGL